MKIKISNKKSKIIMNLPSNGNSQFREKLNVAFQRGVSSIPSVEPGYFRLRICPVRRSASIGRYWKRVGSYLQNASLHAK